jgi:hypothetical protein
MPENIKESAGLPTTGERILPEVVPVLPISEAVIFPYMMVPLVLTDPNLIKLADECLAGDKILGAFAQRSWPTARRRTIPARKRSRSTAPARPCASRRCSVSRRQHAAARAGHRAVPHHRHHPGRAVHPGGHRAGAREGRRGLAHPGLHARRGQQLPQDHRRQREPQRGAEGGRHEHRRPRPPRRPHRDQPRYRCRGEAADARGTASSTCSSWARRSRAEVKQEMDKNQREYFLRQQMKAIQEELGETDERRPRSTSCASDREADLPEEADKAAGASSTGWRTCCRPGAAEYTVIRTYLDWIVDAALERRQRGQPRHPARARASSTRPLRPREGQGPHPRVPRRAQAQPRLKGPSSASSARPASARPRSAAHRRAMGRKFSASRSAACATRPRSAGTAAPTSARCRAASSRASAMPSQQPRLHARRDRQAGPDFRGDPLERLLEVLDPEQNTFRTTTSTCRSTSRR